MCVCGLVFGPVHFPSSSSHYPFVCDLEFNKCILLLLVNHIYLRFHSFNWQDMAAQRKIHRSSFPLYFLHAYKFTTLQAYFITHTHARNTSFTQSNEFQRWHLHTKQMKRQAPDQWQSRCRAILKTKLLHSFPVSQKKRRKNEKRKEYTPSFCHTGTGPGMSGHRAHVRSVIWCVSV